MKWRAKFSQKGLCLCVSGGDSGEESGFSVRVR